MSPGRVAQRLYRLPSARHWEIRNSNVEIRNYLKFVNFEFVSCFEFRYWDFPRPCIGGKGEKRCGKSAQRLTGRLGGAKPSWCKERGSLTLCRSYLCWLPNRNRRAYPHEGVTRRCEIVPRRLMIVSPAVAGRPNGADRTWLIGLFKTKPPRRGGFVFCRLLQRTPARMKRRRRDKKGKMEK